MEGLKARNPDRIPKRLIADAGYGSEENYEYLDSLGIEHYVKYNTYDKEKTAKWRKDILRPQNWLYLPECDQYLYGNCRYLSFIGVLLLSFA